jgi:hypothetical protein
VVDCAGVVQCAASGKLRCRPAAAPCENSYVDSVWLGAHYVRTPYQAFGCPCCCTGARRAVPDGQPAAAQGALPAQPGHQRSAMRALQAVLQRAGLRGEQVYRGMATTAITASSSSINKAVCLRPMSWPAPRSVLVAHTQARCVQDGILYLAVLTPLGILRVAAADASSTMQLGSLQGANRGHRLVYHAHAYMTLPAASATPAGNAALLLLLLVLQDRVRFVFGYRGHASPEVFSLDQLLPARCS